MTIEWRERAACRGAEPELFFPVGERWEGEGNARRAAQAKAVCAGCPVARECLADGLAREDNWGIVGGTLPTERRALDHARV